MSSPHPFGIRNNYLVAGTSTAALNMIPDFVIHAGPNEVRLTPKGMTYRGAMVEDAGAAHAILMAVLSGHPLPPPAAIGAAFAGGIYAGISRGVDGAPDQHLVLLDGDTDGVTWEAACAWAAAKGAILPTRAEQRLLMANLPDQFQARYYWSSEQAGPSFAWLQLFSYGFQDYFNRSYEGRARAVRRVPIHPATYRIEQPCA